MSGKRGPNGEVRRGDVVQRAMQVMRIATGEEEETIDPRARRKERKQAEKEAPAK